MIRLLFVCFENSYGFPCLIVINNDFEKRHRFCTKRFHIFFDFGHSIEENICPDLFVLHMNIDQILHKNHFFHGKLDILDIPIIYIYIYICKGFKVFSEIFFAEKTPMQMGRKSGFKRDSG